MSNSSNKKRGVIYARVSTEEQRKSGHSLPSQIALLEEKMKKDGVEAVHPPITDVDSGRNFEREGLKELLKLAESRSIDYLYVYDLDRLGRNVVETPYLMYKLKEMSVIVRTIDGEYNFENPYDYLKAIIVSLPGDVESRKLGERTQRGKSEKFKRGKWVGPVPFGYIKNAEGALEKLAELESIIIDIFQTYRMTRDIKKTAQIINDKYLNKIGKISTNQVKTIFTNPIYDGRPRYGKTQIRMETLAIVAPELYDEAQSIMESKAKKHRVKERRKPQSILDDLVSEYGMDYVMRTLKLLWPHCPKCETHMVGNGSKFVRGLRLPNFRCNNCGYQRTIPLITELRQFLRNLTRCPKCGVVEDFVKTGTLDGSVEYTCRRCGTSFQFIVRKESEKTDERPANQKSEEPTKPERPPNVKDRSNWIELPSRPIKDFQEGDKKKANNSRLKGREKGRREQRAVHGKNHTLKDFWFKQG